MYYNGESSWTADKTLKSRVALSDIFRPYIPDYEYYLVNTADHGNEELIKKNDISGFYCADGDKANESPVEIAVNICTYKREKYVVRNMRSLMEWLETTDIDVRRSEVADHLHVF